MRQFGAYCLKSFLGSLKIIHSDGSLFLFAEEAEAIITVV